MSKYSTDSDSSVRRRRSRKRRSVSSSSSSSSHHRSSKRSRHHSSSYRKNKSYSSKSRRSHSHSNSNSRHVRSSLKDRRHKRSRSRSRSRERYRSKHHYKSRSESKGHSSKYHSRSSSNDTRSRQSRSPAHSNSSLSSDSKIPATSLPLTNPNNSEDQLRDKLLKAIKAAESADHQLKQQGVLAKGVKSRNDLNVMGTIKPQSEIIKDIDKDEFVQSSFVSSKNEKVRTEDIPMPCTTEDTNNVSVAGDSIFHTSFFCDPKIKLEKWVKKLYQIRQRAIAGEPLGS